MDLINNLTFLQIMAGVFIGIASGYLGSFMILRRMALVGDALSHVALPGIALAFLLNVNPFIGAFSALFLGIVCIWLIESHTELPTESLVGLFFTVSLAIGILITPENELLEALFGDISKISLDDTIISVTFSIVVIAAMKLIANKFMLGTLSPDLAKSARINVSRLNFIFLILVAVIVALGIKAVGTLLMGALVVIPAISAKNISNNLKSFTLTSAVFGLVSLVAGIYISRLLNYSPGPVVVLVSGLIFILSLFLKKE